MAQRMKAGEIGIDKLDARQGRLSIQFRDRGEIPPRVFSILSKKHRDAYLTREAYIWPYGGNPILAVEKMLMNFEEAHRQYEAELSSLEV